MRLPIRVKPGSSRPGVGGRREGVSGDELIVAVNAPAVDGKANEAVIKALAKALRCRRNEIEIIAGATARSKVVEVPDHCQAAVTQLLGKSA